MSDKPKTLEDFMKAAGRLFAAPPKQPERPITQPGPGTTVPTESPPAVRLLTPDGEYHIDPDKPARRNIHVPETLADIRDLLEEVLGHQKPEETNYRTQPITCTAAANADTVHDPVGFNHVYIPPVPRQVAVWAGLRQLFLGTLDAGQYLNADLPYEFHDVWLEYGAGTVGDVIPVSIANRTLNVDIGSAGAAGDTFTPSDTQTNPANIPGTEAYLMAWDTTASQWTRVRITNSGKWVQVSAGGQNTPSDAVANTATMFANSVGSNNPAGVFPFGFNGATWDRPRLPNVVKSAVATASGNTALWTPAASKKFRLMRVLIMVSGNAVQAAAGVLTIQLQDSATGMPVAVSPFVPAAAGTVMGADFVSGWIDLGNGILSAAANNVLNINLSAALTGGTVRAIAVGTEE